MYKSILNRALLILGVIAFSVYLAFPLHKKINLGLDLQGGMYLLLRVDTSQLTEKAKVDAIDRALEIVRNRIDQFGVKEPLIQMQGIDKIVVQLPGMTDRKRALDLIGRTALLEFKLVSADTKVISDALSGNVASDVEVKEGEGERLVVNKTVELTGEYLETADVRFDQSSFGQPMVAMRLKGEGIKKFADVTTNNVGRRLAIILDGRIYSAPRINEPIPDGEAVITGRFTPDEAKDLAIVLRSGSLPAPLLVEEERTVGPLLGQDSIRKGILASAIGCSFVFLFMLFYYGFSGLIANFALILNVLIILGGMGMFHGTLTLPGIAGILLTIGMAVDANVLIHERMREEMKAGRPIRTVVANGYDKAFSAIFDSNITTLIAAFFLFQFGTGPIRGFAVTLTIGLLASLFTSIFVTRVVFDYLLFKNRLKGFKFHSFLQHETHFDFLGKRKFAYIFSTLLLIVGITSFYVKGKNAYGVEFSGGQVQEYRFAKPVAIDALRSSMKAAGLGDVSIQLVKDSPTDVIIRSSQDSADKVQEEFKKVFPGDKYDILKIEKIGPTVGKDLKKKALLAIIYSMLGILFYVAIRFRSFDFASGGVLALFHDVVLATGFVVFMGRQIDLLVVTALLTIGGYSINDTIVIFDRIREMMRTQRQKIGLTEIMNIAMNQILSRTMLTSFVTLLTVLAMFLWGGEVLNTFAMTLLFGFVIGTYSTVFVASPLVLISRRLMQKIR
jgi:SecD/SecF fusion protein